jgi:hypothetical protein
MYLVLLAPSNGHCVSTGLTAAKSLGDPLHSRLGESTGKNPL